MHKLRHTASHIMAQAIKRIWPDAKLAIGPSIENGFYYDFDLEHRFSDEDLAIIEKEMQKIVKEKLPLERAELSREDAIKLFKDEPYKLELIDAIPEGETISTYKQGEFIDLCAGPHVENTGKVKHFKLLSIAGAYWRGDEHNKMLQRIYGTAFETKEDLTAHLQMLKEAAESDHRKLGAELGIFNLYEEAPGMPFFLPNGMTIMNNLMTFWREVHKKYGYDEIKTPIMLKRELWETSGHWDHYAQGMYTLKVDENDYAVKPMNCPGSILVYSRSNGGKRNANGSMKLAEVGLVHRHERHGQLHGLMRVREFTQDDAHIYVEKPDALRDEILNILQMMDEMYAVFGLKYDLELSTRPDDRIGSDEVWDNAEHALEDALNASGRPFKINAGDGAFYGPKIDVHVRDRLGRSWQCGTVQVDFNLPERFNLKVRGTNDRPIMLHRVIYGSIERFIGIITEHFGGKFPLWLNCEPVRLILADVRILENEKIKNNLDKLKSAFESANINITIDDSRETLNKKVRNAAANKVPYSIVVGERELKVNDVMETNLKARVLGGGEKTLPANFFIRYVQKKIQLRQLNY